MFEMKTMQYFIIFIFHRIEQKINKIIYGGFRYEGHNYIVL